MSKTLFCVAVMFGAFHSLKAEIIAVDGNNNKEGFMDYEINFLEQIEGPIVEAYPEDACSNITEPPQHHTNKSQSWILLVNEGVCRIQDKVHHAQAAHYAAVIMYSSLPQPFFFGPRYATLTLPNLNLTTVAISHAAAARLKERYLYNFDPLARVIIVPSYVFSVVTFLLLFAVVAGTFFFMMFLFMIIKCIQRTRHQYRNRLSSVHLNQLKTVKYKQGDPYETCAICLDDYKEKDKLRILPCSHDYHCKCIDPWLTNQRRNCPICKQKVILSGVHSDDDSDSDTDGRAETTPLLLANARGSHHGTFNNRFGIVFREQQQQEDNQGSVDETTSRDVPSDFLDDISEEEIIAIRPSSSAPNLSYTSFAKGGSAACGTNAETSNVNM